jgi:hypothetical protein
LIDPLEIASPRFLRTIPALGMPSVLHNPSKTAHRGEAGNVSWVLLSGALSWASGERFDSVLIELEKGRPAVSSSEIGGKGCKCESSWVEEQRTMVGAGRFDR